MVEHIKKPEYKKLGMTVAYILIAAVMLAAGPWIVMWNRYWNALFLLAAAFGVYFYIVYEVADRNWMDIRAVFHGVWLFTIALASLQLMEYQEDWERKTWFCFAAAYLMFQIGANLGMLLKKRFEMLPMGKNISVGKVTVKFHASRLFSICVITTLVGIGCFFANVMIRGYIPCFSDTPNAYTAFYTKFHVFAVASTVISGLCYYGIKTQNYVWWKKVILWLCILYETFAFPIMVVSRGTLLISAVSLTVAVFYLNKKKLRVLILCVAILMIAYLGTTQLRGYTDEQLNNFFEPSKTQAVEVSSGVSFVYSYFTVSHDNFNEAVQNVEEGANGWLQLEPFNVILRNDKISQKLQETERYLVCDHLNTVNLIGDFYYDFLFLGVVVFMFLWSLVFGIIQMMYEESKNPVVMLFLGIAMTPTALCFFSSWMSNFTIWLMWGTIVLIAAALYVGGTVKKAGEYETQAE